MSRVALNPETVCTPEPPYSQVVAASGTLVAISGQQPLDAEGRIVEGGFAEQLRQAFRNLGHCLDAAGCGYADVIKVTTFLSNLDDFGVYNTVYAEFFEPPYPARSTVGVNLLGAEVEIEALAVRPA